MSLSVCGCIVGIVSQRRNFTRAMAHVPSQFGLVPLKKISALRPQWPWCPTRTALVALAVFSSAHGFEHRHLFQKKKCVFLWYSGNIKWDDAYITSDRFDSIRPGMNRSGGLQQQFDSNLSLANQDTSSNAPPTSAWPRCWVWGGRKSCQVGGKTVW